MRRVRLDVILSTLKPCTLLAFSIVVPTFAEHSCKLSGFAPRDLRTTSNFSIFSLFAKSSFVLFSCFHICILCVRLYDFRVIPRIVGLFGPALRSSCHPADFRATSRNFGPPSFGSSDHRSDRRASPRIVGPPPESSGRRLSDLRASIPRSFGSPPRANPRIFGPSAL